VSQEPGPPAFFVVGESTLFAVMETGDAAPLAEAKFLSVWKDRALVFDDSGMTLYRLSRELQPLFQEKGDIRKMRRRFGSVFQRKVLVRKNGKAFIFNLEDSSFQEIPMPYSPYFYLERNNRFYIVWAREDEISVGEIVNGRLVMKKEWVTAVVPRPWRLVRVYSPGVVVYSQKQFETYLFE
jgi:hypothetical protein